MDSSRATGIPAGTVIGGRYTVGPLLGRGGMASVYRATDVPLGRDVALKVFTIDTEGAGLGRESSEIQLLASLNHHALVTLFDANVDSADHSYLVMELVEGPTLKSRIDAGPIAELDVAQLAVDLAEALHVVHGNGVVHRDVKPANILLSASVSRALSFRAKLSDFGIAYLIDSTRLTMPGTIIGTAAYLSPEQARGVAPGPASDIYSLGLVILESLTGTRAFEGSMVESLSARLVGNPPIAASLGPAWVSLLTRMTARDPEARPTAIETAELAGAIEREVYASSTGGTEVMPAAGSDADRTQPMGAAASLETTALLGSTAPLESTALLGSTARLESTALLGSTAPLDPPTRVMPAPDDDETSVLTSAAPAPAAEAKRPPVGRIVVVAAAALVALGIGVFALSTASNGGDEPAAPVPSLPANEGVLGTHLDELLETVTP